MVMNEVDQGARVQEDGTIHLAPRTIPLPRSISEEARRVLALPRRVQPVYPALDDAEGWRRLAEETNALFGVAADLAMERSEGRATVHTETIAGVTVHIGTPTGVPEVSRDRVRITLHGGGFINLAGAWARAEAALTAAEWSCVTYGVDYRVPPDDPYPAAVDDAIAVYRWLVARHDARDIVVSGTSAGGNLALATALRARDHGLSLPGALIVNTPECDLTESGDTFKTLSQLDGRLPAPIPETIALYAGGHDLTDPYVSPLFADFSAGFSPTYIQSGTRDLFLSNSVRLHRALRNAEVEAELHVWEAAPHGGFFMSDAPEAVEEYAEQARFLAKHWGAR